MSSTNNYGTHKEERKNGSFVAGGGGKKVTETVPDEVQALDLPDKDFNSTISNIFKEP